MKTKVFLFVLAFVALSTTAKAVPVVFEVDYTNFAWGYTNKGCFVDESRFIYKYDYRSGKPMVHVGRVKENEFGTAKKLLNKAIKGKFTVKHQAYDAGTQIYRGYHDSSKVVKLAQTGDYIGKNSAPEAAELVKLMRTWCK